MNDNVFNIFIADVDWSFIVSIDWFQICLTSYRNHYYMFARSLEEADVEYYNNIMQSVAQYAQTGKITE